MHRPHSQTRFASLLAGLLCMVALAAPAVASTGRALPLTSIRELLDDHRTHGDVLIRGTVTYNGREVLIQDQTGAIAANSATPVSLALGDQVEVEGSLRLHGSTPRVDDAHIRNLWQGSTPLPLAITPDEAAEGAYNGMLVAIEGELVRASTMPNGILRLTLGSGDQLFSCVLENTSPALTFSLVPGEMLQCTGVLAVNGADRAFESGSFLVLLRTPRDLHLLRPAPWWTTRHLLLCLVALLPLALLGFRLHLRSLQTRMSLVVEERLRIAREIHDTLAQGFSGIALQLQAIHRSMDEPSTAAHAHLAMALQMVRRSRAEAHRSIATLRTLHRNELLPVVFDKLLRQQTAPAGVHLSVSEQGTAFPLDDELCSQILRISQEAVANTVEHARAGKITAHIQYDPQRVVVTLTDDGCGFNTQSVGSVEHGRFGIAGMQERATQIRATLSIHSDHAGTALRLEVPLPRTQERRNLPRPWPLRPMHAKPQRREVPLRSAS